MSQPIYRQWHDTARTTWPQVVWALERFAMFLAGRMPSEHQDMFLAGAASERVSAAWESIERDRKPRVLPRLYKFANRGIDIHEIWQATMLKALRDAPEFGTLPDGRPPAYIRRYRGESKLESFLAVMGANFALDRHRHSAVERKFEKRLEHDMANSEHQLAADREGPPPTSEENRRSVEVFRATLLQLPERHRGILLLVFRDGMQIGRAGRMVGCRDAPAATRLLQNAVERLAHAMRDLERESLTEEDVRRLLEEIRRFGADSGEGPRNGNRSA